MRMACQRVGSRIFIDPAWSFLLWFTNRICRDPGAMNFEVIPISILEAMSSSLPIIATDVGGIPDIVSNNINGYLFHKGDIEDTTNKIIELANNKKLLIELGLKSKEIVEINYDIHNVFNKQIFYASQLKN